MKNYTATEKGFKFSTLSEAKKITKAKLTAHYKKNLNLFPKGVMPEIKIEVNPRYEGFMVHFTGDLVAWVDGNKVYLTFAKKN